MSAQYMEGPQQQECEEAMQDELGYINTTIRSVSYNICYNQKLSILAPTYIYVI